jgi:hypothetical protein
VLTHSFQYDGTDDHETGHRLSADDNDSVFAAYENALHAMMNVAKSN